ncbi:riboflavin-specific deaminase (diaminohydroxyphosphoribosylaminopyrimidine deaminase [Plesiocystis pacifica SIR-1]|uniref:Riboflavin biosynthesis protein RibD n=1 Tax=Plesiocystis pacifica SIR-1 TaxID=391625 RepID=A6G9U4_9BACT|nr:bifunctional diaminohydroxyphosphoribosylaminopyrimidine deaminase/5-amino-6-(5-phosphoribosylamino)uracil reductase RibD [Plesiocystis pacifica]EDM77380.1 riboflavin-specific deaminase (diaminohydroxyphosphoribosylaminopyrimidine deaminase [Plesiocystis pacifica SIR-1]
MAAKQRDAAHWMGHALRLAKSGTGATYPNPCVGAVLVKKGVVVGRGRSDVTGGPHAEVRALRQAGAAARGAAMYVTLEPCSHRGRTPPCVDAIIEAGVRRVCIGVEDPAPHVGGKGIRKLRRAGLEVEVGVCGDQARSIHAHYLHHVATGRPFVTLKVASSIDGRLATASGDSKWITGAAARKSAHRLRALHHGIAVGSETVLRDNPGLDVRHVDGVDPIPVIFDSRLRVTAAKRAELKLMRAGVLVLYTARASKTAQARLARTPVEGVEVPGDAEGRVDIEAALELLGARELRSLMVEGGGKLLGSFVAADAFEELWVYRAPVILGEGRPILAGLAFDEVARAPRLRQHSTRKLGDDQLTVYARA